MIKNRWNSTIIRKIRGTTPRRTLSKKRKTLNSQNKENPVTRRKNARGTQSALVEKSNILQSPKPTISSPNFQSDKIESEKMELDVDDNTEETNKLPLPLLLSSPDRNIRSPPLLFSPEKPAILKNLSPTTTQPTDTWAPVIGSLSKTIIASPQNSPEYGILTSPINKIDRSPNIIQLGSSPSGALSPSFQSLREHTSKQYVEECKNESITNFSSNIQTNTHNGFSSPENHTGFTGRLLCTETLECTRIHPVQEDGKDKGWTALQMESSGSGKDLFTKAKKFMEFKPQVKPWFESDYEKITTIKRF